MTNIEKQIEELETKFRTHCADQVIASGETPNFGKAFVDTVTPFALTIQKDTAKDIWNSIHNHLEKHAEEDVRLAESGIFRTPENFEEVYKQITGEDYD